MTKSPQQIKNEVEENIKEDKQRKLYAGLIIMGIIGFSLIRLILIVEGKTNYVWMDFVGIIILSLVLLGLILLGLIKPFQKDLK